MATGPGDDLLIERIESATAASRALLCALARRGKELALRDEARAERLMRAARAHPLYKAARIGFDLLELEDLMLDGPPPARVSGYFEAGSVRAIVDSLERLRRALVDASAAMQGSSDIRELSPGGSALARLSSGIELSPEDEPAGGWPALEGGDYLFDLVALGVLRQFARAAAAQQAADGAVG